MPFALDTPRLILRDFVPEDWTAVHAYAADPEVTQYMNWGPNTEAETQAFIAKAMRMAETQPRLTYHLAVVDRITGQMLGGAALRRSADAPEVGELGYTLHPQAWGRGLATELARALLAFGFLELGLARIWATCRPDNQASFRILTKVGLRFEAYQQNVRTVRGQPVDNLLCGVARSAWLQTAPARGAAGEH